MISVHFHRNLDEDTQALLTQQLDDDIQLTTGTDAPNPADYHVLVVGRPTEEQIMASPNLQTVIIPWAGVPEETREILKNYPEISLHNLHHNARATAETALMLMFSAAKLILPIDCSFRENNWVPRYQPNPARLLDGKTMLIIGYGQIGQHVAQVCQALGLRILATRRNPQAEAPKDIQAEIYSSAQLDEILPQVDILMVTAPLTDETRGMIGEKQIGLLPDGAIVVNIGRGPIIDEKALYQALKSGKLHSAGIDVWYNYPEDTESRSTTQPSAYPFHELDNVVMSPHRGGGAAEIDVPRMKHLAKLLNAAVKGQEIPNKINLEEGY